MGAAPPGSPQAARGSAPRGLRRDVAAVPGLPLLPTAEPAAHAHGPRVRAPVPPQCALQLARPGVTPAGLTLLAKECVGCPRAEACGSPAALSRWTACSEDYANRRA